jgi:hypothetical protein
MFKRITYFIATTCKLLVRASIDDLVRSLINLTLPSTIKHANVTPTM